MIRSFRLEAETERTQFDPTTRPVGQVVKTAASHAVNIGSNPVRVTSSNCPYGTNPRLTARLLSQGGQFSLLKLQTLRWFAI